MGTEMYFPKLHVPFIREEVEGELVATPEVKDQYEWVFEKADTVKAVEKIDGENIRVDIDGDGEPISIFRRNGYTETDEGRVYDLKEIPLWDEELTHYTEGVVNAYGNGWIEYVDEGACFGELVGPKVQGNPYDLQKHYWVPFEYAHEKLEYNSYGEYGVSYEDMSNWFNGNLIPLFYSKMHGGMAFDEARKNCSPEGVVFVMETDSELYTQQMAKLRRSDFEWYYTE